MSEEQWEIVQVYERYVVDAETGTLTITEPTVRKLLRRTSRRPRGS